MVENRMCRDVKRGVCIRKLDIQRKRFRDKTKITITISLAFVSLNLDFRRRLFYVRRRGARLGEGVGVTYDMDFACAT